MVGYSPTNDVEVRSFPGLPGIEAPFAHVEFDDNTNDYLQYKQLDVYQETRGHIHDRREVLDEGELQTQSTFLEP